MRYLPILLVLLTSLCATADPHYFQAMHPFGDDAVNNKYLSKFNDPLSVQTDTYVSSSGNDDVYLYVYVFNEADVFNYKLSVMCDGVSTERHKLIMDIARPYVSNNNYITWTLEPNKQKQAVWLYSAYPPSENSYLVTRKNGTVARSGSIKGPSCVK